MIFSIRDARPEDQVPIIDCDIKCFDLAWSTDSWSYVAANNVVKVATFYGTPIGFSVFLLKADEPVVVLPKLGVKPTYRGKGVGRALLKEALVFARQVDARTIETIIPESLLRPGEPAFVGDWMTKMGWRPDGLVREFFPSMGEKEDGVRFIISM